MEHKHIFFTRKVHACFVKLKEGADGVGEAVWDGERETQLCTNQLL